MQWIIPSDITEITKAYVQQNMPAGTTHIVFPKGVQICDFAFQGCTSLTWVDIGTGVQIEEGAFRDCTGLTHVNIAEGVQIESYAFANCTGLRQVDIAAGVQIEEGAFFYCPRLTQVNIAEGVRIGGCAFRNCSTLTQIEIAAGVEIGFRAFEACTGLRELVIHKGVTADRLAFERCNSLRFIIMPDDFPRDILPAEATIVTHSEINDFCSNRNGLQGVEQMPDKIAIYRLCNSTENITQADFKAISHLSVSAMLDVIQAYNAISGNRVQSRKLLVWTMGTKFVDACGDMEVSKMLVSAHSDGASSNLKASLSVKEWVNMRVVSKDISNSPLALFHTKPSSMPPGGLGAANPVDEPGAAEPDPEVKGPSSGKG